MITNKIAKSILVLTMLAVWVMPVFGQAATSPSYRYRNTVLGNGISDRGNDVYSIVNEKYFFNEDEKVYALSRIFEISGMQNFRFRYELIGDGNYRKDVVSHYFNPNGRWWAEVYYWNDFGKLPTGNYELKVSISIDNGSWTYRDNKLFRVGSPNSYNDDWYRPYDPYYRPVDYGNDRDCNYYNDCNDRYYDGTYKFDYTKTGRNVRNTGSYRHEVTNETQNFNTNDQVYVLTKLSNIRRVDSFVIKHEVYRDGNSYYSRNEVPTLYPRNQDWEYNYSWGNLGSLPRGNHEIRSFIKINNGSWRQLGTVRITVGDNNNYYDNRPRVTPVDYSYGWSKADTDVQYRGGYDYELPNPKSEFYDNEIVKVLTRISDIRNARSIEVKHELYRGGSYVKNNSVKKYPNGTYWYYTYFQSDFGRLEAGDYSIKVYSRVNDGTWKALDNVTIKVKARYYTDPVYYPRENYDYDWTVPYSDSTYGNDYDYNNSYNYNDSGYRDNYRPGQGSQTYYDGRRSNYTYYYN